MVPKQNIHYLESKFGSIDVPEDIELTKICDCPPETHHKNLVCLRENCKLPLSSHRFCTGDFDDDDSFDPTFESFEQCCSDFCHYDTYRSRALFNCKNFQVLKTYANNSVLGKIEAKFELAKQEDQKKLDKLITFME